MYQLTAIDLYMNSLRQSFTWKIDLIVAITGFLSLTKLYMIEFTFRLDAFNRSQNFEAENYISLQIVVIEVMC